MLGTEGFVTSASVQCMVAAMYMDLLQDTLADVGPVTSTTGEASPTGAVRSRGK